MDGLALKRARLRQGLSVRQVAEKCREYDGCKVDPSNLHRAEEGKRGQIGASKIPTLLAVLGLSIEELIPDETKKAA